MAIPILHFWENYFTNQDEGLGSSYERIVLNNKLLQIIKDNEIHSLIEVPSFGFTGLSGINSVAASKEGCDVRIVDNDKRRCSLIENTWDRIGETVIVDYNHEFNLENYQKNQFDMSWNFSAMWFLKDIESFVKQLTHITKKVIMICVPNTNGIGYISQKMSGKDDLKRLLREEFIDKEYIVDLMEKNNWKIVEHNYIDCPPWPDIGMSKEKFLKKFGLGILVKENSDAKEPLTIIDYYTNTKPDFAEDMMKYYWLEKSAPRFLKKYWAHHYFLIFKPANE